MRGQPGQWLLAIATTGLVGCAAGPLREARVGPLGRYPEARAITASAASGAAASPTENAVVTSAQGSLDVEQSPVTSNLEQPHLTLRLTVLASEPSAPPQGSAERAMSTARSYLGLAGAGDAGATAGRLEIDGVLLAPDGRQVGSARWEREGAPQQLAGEGGEAVARALARLVPERRREFIARRAADERLILTPSAQTMAPGEIVVSDDEVLLLRLGAGVSRRVQVDLWLGGLPIPAAGGFGGAAHALFAVGGAGLVVFGFFDLGVKVKVLEETAQLPGVALSYDLLDLWGLGAGGAGVVVAGDGVGAGGYGVVGGANAQFNLLTAVAAKHFGPVQLTAGSYVLDNHHYLPQSAGFQSGCSAVEADGNQAAAGGSLDCGSGSVKLGRLPVQVQPFVGSELVLGDHSALMLEGMIAWRQLQDSMVTTGARWLLGWSHPHSVLALDRVRFRLDVAAMWRYEPADHGAHPHGARPLMFPWLGVGAYFL